MKAAVEPSTTPIDQARRPDIERSYGGTLGTLRAQVGDVLRVLESAMLFGELAISSRSVPPYPFPVAVRWLYEISLLSTRDRETRENANKMRRGWDSNPRRACALSGFQDRRIRPLCHPSRAINIGRWTRFCDSAEIRLMPILMPTPVHRGTARCKVLE